MDYLGDSTQVQAQHRHPVSLLRHLHRPYTRLSPVSTDHRGARPVGRLCLGVNTDHQRRGGADVILSMRAHSAEHGESTCCSWSWSTDWWW